MIPPLLPILIWPLVTSVFFKRFAPAMALILTILVGKLLLPATTVWDLPLLPGLTKDTMPALSALLIGALVLKGRARELEPGAVQPGLFPKNKVIAALFWTVLLGSFMTVLFNGDPLIFDGRIKPGLRLYDAFSVVMGMFLLVLPMLLARKYLARSQDHHLLVYALCLGGLIYSLPTLFEARMAPQLNIWTYGFFPHDWRQHVRGGQFRPVVFQSHGLVLGIFLAVSIVATAIMSRLDGVKRSKFLFAVVWLVVTLFISRNLGAFMIICAILPVALFLPARTQLLIASILGAMILLYPMLRGAGLIPVDRLLAFAEQINPERAQSLSVRLSNEDSLLARAQLRPFWGWGIWGRSLVFNEAGQTDSIVDGTWIAVIGTFGWIGYIGQFGLLTLPIILLTFSAQGKQIPLATSGLALLMVVNLIDLIPNSALTPLTWMMAGALIGRLELSADEANATQGESTTAQQTLRPATPYARQAPKKYRVQRQPAAMRVGADYARPRNARKERT